ncbi:MAG TPA: magnesium/cobalt efflux protein [Alphaproteobacteria bacterium]|jgi:CBS domain containing-hemolysin-like protein|nr:magnesium/cobalt efflux protein [Alphaproteobacteria bacterium]HBA43637.1 magnesium/cobalt efflux protein [Alphaproteobacteria bacterium]HBC55248.1 magnesium/cobalt efflux protein [Alphaproteobacteria bacterium]
MADTLIQKEQQNGAANGQRNLLEKLRTLFRPRNESLRQSIEVVIEEHLEDSTDFTPAERQMLLNVIAVGDRRVEDVMVPRADIIAVEIGTSLEELVATFNQAAHSRLPIYRDTLDEPVGMVHIKDLVRRWFNVEEDAQRKFSLAAIQRDILFVPPSMPVVDLLLKMRDTRAHMALVIDEYGGTDGLLTIEDLVEEIVGEIRDEHDEEGPMLTQVNETVYEADARVEVPELEAATGRSLTAESMEDYADTLGGLVSALLGHLPQRGELAVHPNGVEFEVLDADPRTVKRLRVYIQPDEPPVDEPG